MTMDSGDAIRESAPTLEEALRVVKAKAVEAWGDDPFMVSATLSSADDLTMGADVLYTAVARRASPN